MSVTFILHNINILSLSHLLLLLLLLFLSLLLQSLLLLLIVMMILIKNTMSIRLFNSDASDLDVTEKRPRGYNLGCSAL